MARRMSGPMETSCRRCRHRRGRRCRYRRRRRHLPPGSCFLLRLIVLEPKYYTRSNILAAAAATAAATTAAMAGSYTGNICRNELAPL